MRLVPIFRIRPYAGSMGSNGLEVPLLELLFLFYSIALIQALELECYNLGMDT